MSGLTLREIRELLQAPEGASQALLASLAQDPRQGVQALLQAYQARLRRQEAERARLGQLYSYERQLAEAGYSPVCGVDEAGRGPLAGPMVVAGVSLPLDAFLPGLNDSKKLSASARARLYEAVLDQALGVEVALISVSTIDRLNVYQAAKWGFQQVIERLRPRPAAALTDAMPLPAAVGKVVSLVHGDARSAAIAAASIVAKVTRDRLMLELDRAYPVYGFARHKGYGSREHLAALARYGPCPQHRRSYEPVKSLGLGPAPVEEDLFFSPLAGQYRLRFD